MNNTLNDAQPAPSGSGSGSGSRQSSPPVELGRVTSNANIPTNQAQSNKEQHRLSARLSQSAPRLGSRSPNSIPPSPTSVHSSSSAIFERDIEPITPSPPLHSTNPHLIPRSKATEQIEHAVPSVLDSAAAVLTSPTLTDDESDRISVIAPIAPDVASTASGFTSPIGASSRSRSPSPGREGGKRRSVGSVAGLMLNLPSPTPSAVSPLPPLALAGSPVSNSSSNGGYPVAGSSPPRPAVEIVGPGSRRSPPVLQQLPSPLPTATTPSSPSYVSTPTSAYYSAASISSAGSSPKTTTVEYPSQSQVMQTPTWTGASPTFSASSPTQHAQSASVASPTSHPPSPNQVAAKRLSFMSYSDLLSSAPASALPLSSLTTSATAADPPPHIPSVSGFTQAQAHAHSHSHSSAASSIHNGLAGLAGMKEGPLDPVLLEDDGGEWEREGLGRGLEERLEALMVGGIARG